MKKRLLFLLLPLCFLPSCSNLTPEQNQQLLDTGLRIAEQKISK